MLEDRIIVQDRGIDAGLAALMQNANKGMDPAALMAMMNNGGFGGNGGWWWIWIILIFFCWDGSGAQMTNNEITTGNRYLIYYNKCDGIFQVINHIVTPTTPAT